VASRIPVGARIKFFKSIELRIKLVGGSGKKGGRVDRVTVYGTDRILRNAV
jgi:hypothetical protein